MDEVIGGEGEGERNGETNGERKANKKQNKTKSPKPSWEVGRLEPSRLPNREKLRITPLDLEVRLGVLIPGRESALAAWHVLALSPPLFVPCPVENLKARAWGGKHWISELVLKWAIWDLR